MSGGSIDPTINTVPVDTTVDTILLTAPNIDLKGNTTVLSTTPQLWLEETDGVINEKHVLLKQSGGAFTLTAVDDAHSAGSVFFSVARTGTTVNSIDLTATNINVNGILQAGSTANGVELSFNGAGSGMIRPYTNGNNHRSIKIEGLFAGVANANQLVVDYLGNVGIGTIPSNKLHVDGITRVSRQGAATQYAQIELDSSGTKIYCSAASGSLNFGTDGGTTTHFQISPSTSTFYNNLTISNVTPILSLYETDGSADNKNWRMYASSESFNCDITNDAVNASNTWLAVQRTGITIDSIDLSATNINLNGKTKITMASGDTLLLSKPSGANILFERSGVKGYSIDDSAGDLRFLSSGTTERFRINASGNSTFKGDIKISSTTPTLIFNETDAPTDEGNWRILSEAGNLIYQSLSDSGAVSITYMSVAKTGTTIDSIDIAATNINLNGKTNVIGDTINVTTQKTPASATATGTKGDIVHDTNYIYVCTATNVWKRSALVSW